MPAKPIAKCTRCRIDKQKCEPVNRRWPAEKCNRCRRYNYPCSAPTVPGQGSQSLDADADEELPYLTKHDVVLSIQANGRVESRSIFRFYIGEGFTDSGRAGERSDEEEDLSLLPSHQALTQSRPEAVSWGMNLSERDAKDGTLLHRAVKRQDKDWVRWLVEHGAEVNVQDAQGMTPLHEEAYAKGDGTVAELLFIAGADESIPNKEGLNALHYAALASNLATLRKFINYTTNINEADSNGDTLLHHAADDDWIVPGRITELVRAGADVHARNNKGQTPLHVAVGAQRNDTAHDLLRCQASINAIDDRGRSPIIVLLDTYGLFFDSTLGKYEVGEGAYSALPRLFTILMEQEPDIMLRDDRGASALNVALSLYLKWQEKDAFEPECRNPSPSSSLKSKFKTWMKKDLMGLGAGRREPRVKIPAEVHYIWRRLILPTLQNAELDQSLVELMADDLEVADDLNFRSQDTEDSRGRIDARK